MHQRCWQVRYDRKSQLLLLADDRKDHCSPERKLAPQVAIITGSGQGVGAAAAKLFAEHGAKVVVTDIDTGKSEQVGGFLRAFEATLLMHTIQHCNASGCIEHQESRWRGA